ncbi:MAG: sigma-70 family RNA polymerase sigma factor [Cyclobacteriaceae bacterium]
MKKIFFKNSDKSTVLHLKEGDEKAFTTLFDKYAQKIYCSCRKLQMNHEDAEGVVQDVFLKIWRNRGNLNEELSFNSYVLTIAKSMIIKASRKQVLHLAYEQHAAFNQPSYNNQTEDYIIFSDLEALSQECMDHLPKQQRQVFMMKTQDNFTMDQISEELDITKRTAENHFYRACKELKLRLINYKAITAEI